MTRLPGAVLLVTAICGCAVPSNYSGFYENRTTAAPTIRNYRGDRPPVEIDNAEQRVILIYSHGTTNSSKREHCGAFWNRIPNSILALQREDVLVYFLCSKVVEPTWSSPVGHYVYQRLEEIEHTVDELIALGVSPQRIFLAGHSAGGWVSLMAASKFPEKVNAVVAFAPAFAGKRANEQSDPRWRRESRPRQIEDMLQAIEINALVFAYQDDPYNRPSDLAFLSNKYPDTVTLIGYKCHNFSDHIVHLNDCREAETTSLIHQFVDARLP